MELQEPRLINVLVMLCRETQQQRQLARRAGFSEEPGCSTHSALRAMAPAGECHSPVPAPQLYDDGGTMV